MALPLAVPPGGHRPRVVNPSADPAGQLLALARTVDVRTRVLEIRLRLRALGIRDAVPGIYEP